MEQQLPLSGYKVIELATVVAAPVAARLMADYGAEVIKVETPPYGDPLRQLGDAHGMPTKDDNHPLFDAYNTGKKFVSLNLKKEEDMNRFLKLLEDADVLITNIRMQSLQKMKIDYDCLKERFPKLVYAHFSGFGLEGGECNRPGYDLSAFWARSGALTDMGTPGAYPVNASFAAGDIISASGFVSGILMALLGRVTTGHGTMISTSLMKSGMWCNTTSIMNSQPQYGRVYPADRYTPWTPFSNTYKCKDGKWLAIMVKNYDREREMTAEVFGFDELRTNPDLVDLATMTSTGNIGHVTKCLEEIMASKTLEEWCERLDAYDVPNQPAKHFSEAYQDPQARANHCFDDVTYPDGTVTAFPTPPMDFSEYGRKSCAPTGSVGCDNDEIFGV